MNLEYGISVRPPYREERMNDLADLWIKGEHDKVLEAVRLHNESVRARITRCEVTKMIPKPGRWSKAPIADIISLRCKGFSLREIAESTGLSKRTICRILKKQTMVKTTPMTL